MALAATAGCESYQPAPLPATPVLTASINGLRAPGVDTSGALRVSDIAALAVANNPDLAAARTQRRVAQAQVFQAGILPNPTVTAAILPLAAGPAGAGPAATGRRAVPRSRGMPGCRTMCGRSSPMPRSVRRRARPRGPWMPACCGRNGRSSRRPGCWPWISSMATGCSICSAMPGIWRHPALPRTARRSPPATRRWPRWRRTSRPSRRRKPHTMTSFASNRGGGTSWRRCSAWPRTRRCIWRPSPNCRRLARRRCGVRWPACRTGGRTWRRCGSAIRRRTRACGPRSCRNFRT